MEELPQKAQLPTPERANPPEQLLVDIRSFTNAGRDRVAQAVNSELVMLHWQIGGRIRREILKEERAEYGEQVVEALSQILTAEYGRGYSRKSLLHMIRFAEVFPQEQIVSTLSRQLAWSHFLEIFYLKEPVATRSRRNPGCGIFNRTAASTTSSSKAA